MDILEEENAFVADAPRSIEEIKASYPDEWILLGNPVMEEHRADILSGIVLYHSRDKREVSYLGRPRIEGYDTTALFFNRVTPHREKRQVIASIFSTWKQQ